MIIFLINGKLKSQPKELGYVDDVSNFDSLGILIHEEHPDINPPRDCFVSILATGGSRSRGFPWKLATSIYGIVLKRHFFLSLEVALKKNDFGAAEVLG